eukprot:3706320-Prymnesium_polylepis.1
MAQHLKAHLPDEGHQVSALEGAREGVAVELLQQPPARAEVDGVDAEAVGQQRRAHVAHRVERDAVALQQAGAILGWGAAGRCHIRVGCAPY